MFETSDIITIILRSSTVAKFVLLVLLFFSVASWAVFVEKIFRLRKVKRQGLNFLGDFEKYGITAETYTSARSYRLSLEARLFIAAYRKLETYLSDADSVFLIRQQDERGEAASYQIDMPKLMAHMKRYLEGIAPMEVSRLERYLGFLGTTGAITPFIGLFGTVWGIMHAFKSIEETQSANIASVAPGITDALIATAAGLAVAIPAVIAFNIFSRQIGNLSQELDTFIVLFLSRMETTRFYEDRN